MAVAVKNNRETKSSAALQRLPVGIVLGVLFVLAGLAVVFPLLDAVWWTWLGFSRAVGWSWVGRIAVGAAVAFALLWLGRKLLGPEPQRGLCAGITFGVVAVLLIALLTQYAGTLIEAWVYAADWPAATSWWVGASLTVAFGAALLAGLVWLIFNRDVDRGLGAIEDQGWLSPRGYKPTQGQRVRRGTILSLLVIIGTGIWSLSGNLDSAGDWALNVPFTGRVLLTPDNVGDNEQWAKAAHEWSASPADTPPPSLDRFTARDLNRTLQGGFVRVVTPGGDDNSFDPQTPTLVKDQIIPRTKYEEIRQIREDKRKDRPGLAIIEPPTVDAVVKPIEEKTTTASSGPISYLNYVNLTLLPTLKFTAPLLLGLLGLWFAWRVVNVPPFADFLIATEAELNKVSWTSQKRLIQDTIVVLVTVILLTAFLFFADFGWSALLRAIGVLQTPPPAEQKGELPW